MRYNIWGLAFATLYILLAIQAEPVTATLGFLAGGLLAVGTLMKWKQSSSE
jgi:hypothetical protein